MPAYKVNKKPDCFNGQDKALVWLVFVAKGEKSPYAHAGCYIHEDVLRVYWKISGFTIAQAKDLRKSVLPQMREVARKMGCRAIRVITTAPEDVDFMKMVKFMKFDTFRLVAEQAV